MYTIEPTAEKDQTVIHLAGRIDSTNAGDAEARIRAAIQASPDLPWVLDAEGLDYISSAGLRILLALKKETKGSLTIRNVSPPGV